ncbi:MAG TPA: hypothetical protein VJV79_32315 [Polyangiaceae bacterium]|nr:hypothetical protein [Polyangiaceae bacterium]
MERLRHFGLLMVIFMSGCAPSKEARSAGQIGCTPGEITISNEENQFGVVQSGETWEAECQGRTFVCTQINQSGKNQDVFDMLFAAEQVSCHERPESPVAERSRQLREATLRERTNRPPSTAPTGIAGFAFGETPEDAASRCEAAGQAWRTGKPKDSGIGTSLANESASGSANSNGKPGCSGPAASLGIAASVDLEFCEGRACSITLEHVPRTLWSRSSVSLKSKLESKYGPAQESRGIVPEHCRSEEAFTRCLESQQLALSYTWRWAGGESIVMSVGKPKESGIKAIRLVYRRLPGANVSAL